MSLRLPRFALQRRLRASSAPAPFVALSARDGGRERVTACTAAAEAAGVRAGMSVAAARALCSALVVLREDPPAEARALRRLAAHLLRFTPDVCLDGPAALQLEIGRTARHFGGEAALADAARAECAALGFTAAIGVAETPEAARVLARAAWLAGASEPWRAIALAPLPIDALDPPAAAADACAILGVRTIGELLELPRSGLAARTDVAFVQRIARMLGDLPEPLERIAPPELFDEEIELLGAATCSAEILFAARRLLGLAEAELERRERALLAATFTLVPRGREAARRIAIEPSEPTRDARLLERLLGHRLERERLAAPVEIVRLAFERTAPCRARQDPLFEGACDRDFARDAAALRDRLAVRLGHERVAAAELTADPRPECAFRLRTHGAAAPAARAALAAGARPVELEHPPRPLRVEADAAGSPCALREGGRTLALRVVRGPERVVAGWWDGRDVQRAYFEVETGDGARLWLFRDLATGAFFRHGVFA